MEPISRRKKPAKEQTLTEENLAECKAAFLSSATDSSTKSSLPTKEDLLLALQNTGRNPTQKSVNLLWKEYRGDINFETFCKICKKIQVTSEDDLMKAFKRIDLNGDGYISHAELKKVMTTKGEPMTDDEISRLIDDVDENKDGKLDYKEFTNMVLKTSQKCTETAKRRMNRTQVKSSQFVSERKYSAAESVTDDVKEKVANGDGNRNNSNSGSRLGLASRSPRLSPRLSPRHHKGQKAADDSRKDKIGSQTSLHSHDGSATAKPSPPPRPFGLETHNKFHSKPDESPKPAPRKMSQPDISSHVRPAVASLKTKLLTPSKLHDWQCLSKRGMFYLEEGGVLSSSQYQLTVTKPTTVWLTITPSPAQSTANIDYPLDSCLLLSREKPDKNGNMLLTLSEKRDPSGKHAVQVDLDPGTYSVIPYCTGCRLPLAQKSMEPQKKLIKLKSGSKQYTLTKEFKYVLTDIFNMVDTDMNNLLSREEFSQYSQRTGDDEVGDEEWNVVKENTKLVNDQLTCKGFIHLIELEAEDAAGDVDDLWVSLEAMGYDGSLTQINAYPYIVEAYAEADKHMQLTCLHSLANSKSKSLNILLREAYSNKGVPLPSESRCKAARSQRLEKDVLLYCYQNETSASILIDNKLGDKVKVKLDCSSSKNVKSNRKSLVEVLHIPAKSSQVVMHMVPENEMLEWSVSCVEVELHRI